MFLYTSFTDQWKLNSTDYLHFKTSGPNSLVGANYSNCLSKLTLALLAVARGIMSSQLFNNNNLALAPPTEGVSAATLVQQSMIFFSLGSFVVTK